MSKKKVKKPTRFLRNEIEVINGGARGKVLSFGCGAVTATKGRVDAFIEYLNERNTSDLKHQMDNIDMAINTLRNTRRELRNKFITPSNPKIQKLVENMLDNIDSSEFDNIKVSDVEKLKVLFN